MYKKIIDYLSGELNWLKILRFKWQLRRNDEMKSSFIEYKRMWDELRVWKEDIKVPEIEVVHRSGYPLRLKPAFLFIIAIIGIGIGFYLGLNSYISASDYMNYAVEVLYEE